ncbi:heavy metal translocating P-type ATPase [Dactylosporangium sp. CS-047395]|uniref:heavy metal translocating P-type ATPase n=1 Tax=Dactylosporangium sp. CS-047395 TaxID=3239936 RepID=UPI003D8DF838
MTLTSTQPATPATAAPSPARPRRLGARMWALAEIRWAAIAAVLFAAGGLAQLSGAPAAVWWSLYLACYVTGGWEPALAGLRALRRRMLDVDLLMIVAAIGAASIGQVFDGALLIVIFATSGALEAFATARTADSVRALLDLAPDQATRLDPGGTETVVPAAGLVVGDLIRVRPGERIGADAVVVTGDSDVDQATITGEPLPVAKTAGDEVFAGTLNGTGALTARVHRAAGDTVIARIVAMVGQASATKSRARLFIERIEQRYSIGVVVATLALFAVPLLFGAGLQPTLLRAMTFMIVASPCAVVLATMPPLLSAIALAGRHGVLVKSAVVMEQLAGTTVVAFDKTGTLTTGAIRVTGVHPATGAGLDEASLLRLVAAVETHSEHPLGAAIVTAAREHGLRIPPAEHFRSAPGHAVAATIGGRHVRAGKPTLFDAVDPAEADGAVLAQVRQVVTDAQDAGRTAVAVVVDGRPAGVIVLADQVRAEAATTVAALATVTGTAPVLLTGDNAGAARRLAAATGIVQAHAGLLPSDKVERVRALQQQGGRVMLVGDGVNDAPALATADLGVAMGRHGSDLALTSADLVLVRDDLTTLPPLIALSRRARRVVVANLVIAGAFIAVLVAWDLFADLPLPLGVAGHEGSTVIVGLNGLRLLTGAAWRRATRDAAPRAAAELPDRPAARTAGLC